VTFKTARSADHRLLGEITIAVSAQSLFAVIENR
jgi:hypothetical protein